MRKFVSAITSLAIAATALSGTMMFSASAADTTIFEFRSNGENAVTVSAEDIAAGTVSVPVVMYVPASSGFNTASLKMAINGAETVGQYAGQTINGVDHTEHHFGNYGIVMEVYNTGEDYEGFSYPCCLDGGEVAGEMAAGYAMWCSPVFVPSSYNMNYQHSEAVQAEKNIDAYGAYAADGTSGVTTWDESAAWAYEYGLIEFNLVLPQNLAEGTYVLDVFKDEYVNIASLHLPTPTKGKSRVTGIDGEVAWESRALTITVGDGAVTTTTTETEPTTTTTTETEPPVVGDGIVIDFDDATVAPGETATLTATITGDTGTAGASLYFLYDEALTLDTIKVGNAYRVSAQLNTSVTTTDGKNNVAAYVWAKDSELTAADGASIVTMTFTAPAEPGEYQVGLLEDLSLIFDGVNEKFNEINDVDGKPMPFTVLGGTITVAGDVTTTTTESTTTTTETTTTETTTTTSSTTPEPGEIFWGDVDCDNDVDIADVVRLNKFNAGNADVSEQGQLNADCAFDGELDAEDALAIKKYLAHLIAYEELGDQ